MLKKLLKSCFAGRYLISELHAVESWLMPKIVSDETAVRKYHKSVTGKELDLDNPQTFVEKTNWYKLRYRNPLMPICADKASARDYVASKGLERYLNESYGLYEKVNDIDLDALPNSFVLKATHGSHMNLMVKDKTQINWKQERLMMKSWLHQDIAWSGREWVYKYIPKRIIAERYLEDQFGELRDYKFFCFNGQPEYLEYDIGRFGADQRRNYYDMKSNLVPLSDGSSAKYDEPFPLTKEQYEEMQHIASILSEDFPFVRVDLYAIGKQIYFGEMTFFDGGGSTVFTPDEWNYKFSEKWVCEIS